MKETARTGGIAMADRGSDGSARRESHFWAKTGGLLAIFGAVFSLTTFLIPVSGTGARLVLSASVVGTSVLLYRAAPAVRRGTFDWVSALLVVAMLGLSWTYTALVVHDRNTVIASLEARTGTHESNAVSSDDSRTPTNPATTTPRTTPTIQTGGATAPSTLATFDPSPGVEVFSTGSLELEVGEYGLLLDGWKSSFGWGGELYSGEGSDITFRDHGIVGRDRNQLGLLRPNQSNTYATCRDHTAWVPSLGWEQLDVGTFACVRTGDGRRGVLRVDQMPDFDDDADARVEVSGIVWKPIVDE